MALGARRHPGPIIIGASADGKKLVLMAQRKNPATTNKQKNRVANQAILNNLFLSHPIAVMEKMKQMKNYQMDQNKIKNIVFGQIPQSAPKTQIDRRPRTKIIILFKT